MYVPGHMLQVGCGSVGFTRSCASSTAVGRNSICALPSCNPAVGRNLSCALPSCNPAVGRNLSCALSNATVATQAAAAKPNAMRICDLLLMALHRMRLDQAVVQLDAKPGPIGNGDGPLHEQLVRLQHFGPPLYLAPLQLEEAEVLQHGAHLDARGSRDRTARVVGRHLNAVRFGHSGDACQLE